MHSTSAEENFTRTNFGYQQESAPCQERIAERGAGQTSPSPLRGGGDPLAPLRGGRGPPPPYLGGGEGGSSQREEPAGAHHAWLAWPWASQAITRERFRVPAVLATCVPWACEWAAGCARERRALVHSGGVSCCIAAIQARSTACAVIALRSFHSQAVRA